MIHWKDDGAEARAERLRRLGHRVEAGPLDSPGLKALRTRPPAAVVIDLSRLPSQGRDIGVALRQSPRTRGVPLLFVGGQAEKVARVQRLLPDAAFTTWDAIGEALQRALAEPPSDPIVPDSALAGYSGTPLPRKLGVKSGATVVLVNAPDEFADTLGELPAGVTLRWQDRGRRDLTVWFVNAVKDLERRIERMAAKVGDGGLWIAWPKKASGVETDVTQDRVRRAGLDAGLVDYKICAIDETWSGLKFATRK